MRRCSLALRIGLAVSALAAAPLASADLFDAISGWFDKDEDGSGGFFNGLQISGRGELSVRQNFTSGSEDAYQAQFWNTSPVQAQTSFDVVGPIYGNFGLRAHLANSGYGYNDNRLVLGYQSANTALLWGDLNVNISGNEFATYSKSLEGWQLDHRVNSNMLVRGFTSEEKGLVRRQTFAGNNTSGPYFLTFTPVVDGSELVKVDERPMRFGEDYTLDYDTGQMWFEPPGRPPTIVPSTSVISVSYQSASNYDTGGTTTGMQLETTLLHDNMHVTVTRLEHSTATGGSNSTARFQEDKYQGSGSTGPFDTQFSPILADGATAIINGQEQIIRQALIFLVDETEWREGELIDSYRDIGRVITRQAVPPTSVVRIRYYYQVGPSGGGFGNASVTGVALQHRVSPDISWNLTTAQSDSGGESGLALSTGARYRRGNKFDVDLQYRDIDPNYSYIDTVGFFRNEKGLTASFGYRPNEKITFNHRFSDVKTDSGYSYGYSGYAGGTGFGVDTSLDALLQDDEELPKSLDVRALRNDSNLTVMLPGWPRLNLSRQTLENSGGSQGNSTLETNNINLDYAPSGKAYSLRFGMIDTSQNYAGVSGADETDPLSQPRGSSTRSMNLSGSWTPSDSLSFATHFSQSESSSGFDNQRSSSDNLQLSTRWRIMDNLDLNLDWSRTESLGAVSSGFYGGGYGGYTGGGGGGTIGGRPFSLAAALLPPHLRESILQDEEPVINRYTDSNSRLGLSWQPTDKVNVDANFGLRKYESAGSVGYLADSDQRYANLGVSWLPGSEWSVNANLGSDLLQFLDTRRGGVLNNSFALGASYRPDKSDLSYRFNLNRQWGVSPDYAGGGADETAILTDTELTDIGANVEYRLNERSRVTGRIGLSDFKSGYSDFAKQTAEIAMNYELTRSMGLNFGWQFIRNDSRLPQGDETIPGVTATGQDYTTNLLMLSLSTNFQGSVSGRRDREAGQNRSARPGGGLLGGGGGWGGFGSGYSGGGLSLNTGNRGYNMLGGQGGMYGRQGGTYGGQGGMYGGGGSSSAFSSSYGSYGSFGQGSYDSYGGNYGGGSYGSFGAGGPSAYGGGRNRGGEFAGIDGFDDIGDEDGSIYGPTPQSDVWRPGAGPGQPGAVAPRRDVAAQPTVGDPWSEVGGTDAFPIDDMRDI